MIRTSLTVMIEALLDRVMSCYKLLYHGKSLLLAYPTFNMWMVKFGC